MIKNCKQCGNEFNAKGSRQKNCSLSCYHESLRKPLVTIKCESCGISRAVDKSRADSYKGYCKKCFPEYCKTIKNTRKKPVQNKAEIGIKKCKFCENDFEYRINHKRVRVYCSQECYQSNSFKDLTHEQRMQGIKTRSESKKWKEYVESITGKNNKRYKGNRDARVYNYELKKWREDVFKRDDYTCQKCNQRGGKLEAHHIKKWAKYKELRTTLSNGITLCYDCHNLTHGKVKRKKTYKCLDCDVRKNDGRRERCRRCAAIKRMKEYSYTNPKHLSA